MKLRRPNVGMFLGHSAQLGQSHCSVPHKTPTQDTLAALSILCGAWSATRTTYECLSRHCPKIYKSYTNSTFRCIPYAVAPARVSHHPSLRLSCISIDSSAYLEANEIIKLFYTLDTKRRRRQRMKHSCIKHGILSGELNASSLMGVSDTTYTKWWSHSWGCTSEGETSVDKTQNPIQGAEFE